MAWRIDESVVRGEIDNRTRGRVIGRIWFLGRDAPVQLDLVGDAWRDLAGRRLEFVNPTPKPPSHPLDGFAARQSGQIGDCTASRKVRVPEVSIDELMELYRQRKPFPWHWGNSLYFEWFGNANGRVVIESANYRLIIDPEIAWEMSPVEETAQRRANAEAMGGFFQKFGDAVATDRIAPGEPDDDAPSDWRETPGTDAATHETESLASESISEPVRPRHPLVLQAVELHVRAREEAVQRGWMPSGASDEHPLADVVLSVRDAARKLAGALNGYAWPPKDYQRADVIDRLEKARGFLAHAQLAGAFCQQEKRIDTAWLIRVEHEIDVLTHECNRLLGELRPI